MQIYSLFYTYKNKYMMDNVNLQNNSTNRCGEAMSAVFRCAKYITSLVPSILAYEQFVVLKILNWVAWMIF